MKRAIFWFKIAFLFYTAVLVLALSRDWFLPWFAMVGIDLDSDWVLRVVISMLIIPLAIPLTIMVISILDTGTDEAGQDVHGYRLLKLKIGARWFGTVTVPGLIWIVYMATVQIGGPIAQIPVVFLLVPGAITVFLLWVLLWFWAVWVKYDESMLIAKDLRLREQQYYWTDIEDITYLQDKWEYQFSFKGGRMANISTFYSGIDHLLYLADYKLYPDA